MAANDKLSVPDLLRQYLVNLLSGVAAKSSDEYQTALHLQDQAGAGGVLTFSFGKPTNLYIVTSIGGISRADSTGGTPSATQGIVCVDGGPTYVPVANAGTIKVYAPAGATVSCSALVRI